MKNSLDKWTLVTPYYRFLVFNCRDDVETYYSCVITPTYILCTNVVSLNDSPIIWV